MIGRVRYISERPEIKLRIRFGPPQRCRIEVDSILKVSCAACVRWASRRHARSHPTWRPANYSDPGSPESARTDLFVSKTSAGFDHVVCIVRGGAGLLCAQGPVCEARGGDASQPVLRRAERDLNPQPVRSSPDESVRMYGSASHKWPMVAVSDGCSPSGTTPGA